MVLFVGADALFGETIGLVVGISVGLLEFAFVLIKDKKADPFVAADTILLAVAGGLSLVLRDEIFFRIKPAIIEFVLAVAMGVMLALPPAYLKGYVGKQLRGVSIPDGAMPAMKKGLALLLAALAAHIALTLYAAFALSTAAWGFISGGLLYILFGAVALVQFISARLRSRRIAASSSLAETLLARGSRSSPGERARARALLEECVALKEAWSSRQEVRGKRSFSYSSRSPMLHPSPAPELLRLAELLEKTGGDAEAAAAVREKWLSCLRLVADRIVSLNKNDFRAAAMLLASAADAAEGSAPAAAEEARERAREKILQMQGGLSGTSGLSGSAFVLGSPGPELSRRVSAAFSEPVGGLVSGSACPRDLWDAGGLPRW